MEVNVQLVTGGRDDAVAASAEIAPSVRWAIVSLSLSMLLSSLGTSIANVALPTLAQTFAASFQDVQWVVLAYLLAITTLVVSAGRLGDMTGRRRLLLAGFVLFTVASVLCGAAPTLWLLIAARAAQGLGAAVMMALTMAFVGETVPKAKTGSAMGLLGTMSAIGTALGPSLGGILIAGLSWRAIFLVNVPLGVLALLLAHRHLPVDLDVPETERGADRGHRSEQPHGAAGLCLRNRFTDKGHGEGHHDGRSEALHRAGGNQQPERGRDAAQDRGNREQDDPGQ